MFDIFSVIWILTNAFLFPFEAVCFFNSVQIPRIKKIYIYTIYILPSSFFALALEFEIISKAITLVACLALLVFVSLFLYKGKMSRKVLNLIIYYLVVNMFDIVCSFVIALNKNFTASQMRTHSVVLLTATSALALYFISKFINNKMAGNLNKKGFIFLIVPISHLAMSFAFAMIISYYAPYYAEVYTNIGKIEFIASMILCGSIIFALLADIIAFNQYVKSLNAAKIEARNESLEHINELNTQYFESLRDKEDELRKIKHDISGSLETVKEMLYEQKDIQKAEEFFDELSEYVTSLNTGFYSSDSLVNAIVSQKEKKCAQINISFSSSIVLPEKIYVSDTDLCCALVNSLDNAIETVLTNSDNKTISLKISTIGEYICIKVENSHNGHYFDTSTRKVNKSEHGFSLKMLRDIAEKYNGSFSLEPKDDKVVALLTLENKAVV